MPLYLVSFTEDGGSRRQCQIQAATVADHIDVAVKKLWGKTAYWTWVPGSDTEGCVYDCYGKVPSPHDFPRTRRTTVQVLPAQRRPRVS